MKLFLTSAGLPPETTPYFLELLEKDPKGIKLCFIPTASDLEEDKNYVEKDRKRLFELGFDIMEVDIKKEDENSLKEKFKDVEIVYVEGGNTFYLLKYIRESGFLNALKPFLEKGGIYVGVSAGSYISCPTIEAANWKYADRNIVGLKDLTALNLVPFLIIAHFEEKYRSIIEKAASQTKYPIIAINDEQAVLVKDNDTKIVGSGEKIVFNTTNRF